MKDKNSEDKEKSDFANFYCHLSTFSDVEVPRRTGSEDQGFEGVRGGWGFSSSGGGSTLSHLVGGKDLVNPAAELGDTSVDGRSGGGATAASPGNDTHQSPGVL